MELPQRHLHRVETGGDYRRWPIKPFCNLPQRTDQVPPALRWQVDRLLNGGDDLLKRGLQKRGWVSHGDQASYDSDGWGCLRVYFGTFWEMVNSIKRRCT